MFFSPRFIPFRKNTKTWHCFSSLIAFIKSKKRIKREKGLIFSRGKTKVNLIVWEKKKRGTSHKWKVDISFIAIKHGFRGKFCFGQRQKRFGKFFIHFMDWLSLVFFTSLGTKAFFFWRQIVVSWVQIAHRNWVPQGSVLGLALFQYFYK